jgi:hypothetical protein
VTTLTPDQALAAAAHHHSLARPGSSIPDVADELVGLHNTSPFGPYFSLRARIAGFARVDLDALMWESWRLTRFRAMRLTMFVFPHDLLEVAAAATRGISESLAERWLRDSGLSQREFDALATGVLAALADGPLTARALRRALDAPQSVDLPGVVSRLCDAGHVVGGAPPRSWRSSIRRYHRWEDVLPNVDLRHWDEDAATREQIRRYISSYGPVTINDISWWTGLTKGRCREAMTAQGDRIEEVAVDGWPGPLYCIAGAEVENTPGDGVAALPLLDPYVQGYRDRIRFLDPERNDFVYDGGGNAAATLVHRGRIIGVWQITQKPEESVRYHLFSAGSPAVRRAAEAELAAAGSLYFDRSVDVVEMATMEPLSAGGGRSASHPLDRQLHRASRRRRQDNR